VTMISMSISVRVITQVDGTAAKKITAVLAVVEEWLEDDPRLAILPDGAGIAWLLANGYAPNPSGTANGWYKDSQVGTIRRRIFALPTDVFETADSTPPEPEPEPTPEPE